MFGMERGLQKRLVGTGAPSPETGQLLKMSKSLNNAIFLSDDADTVQKKVKGNPAAEAAAPAVAGGGLTPLIPQWAAVENPPNPVKSYMTAVLEGKPHSAAAKSVEDEINKRLSQKQ